MKYTISAKETLYKDILFRSRLEAKWAAMFDLLGWEWQYEPFDLEVWSPDFLVESNGRSFLVEVKPLEDVSFASGENKDLWDKITVPNQVTILLGVSPVFKFFEYYDFVTMALESNEERDDYGVIWVGSPAQFKIVAVNSDDVLSDMRTVNDEGIETPINEIEECSFFDSLAAEGNGISIKAKIKSLWAQAHNLTRFTYPNNGATHGRQHRS